MNALCARSYPRQASWLLTEVNFHPFNSMMEINNSISGIG